MSDNAGNKETIRRVFEEVVNEGKVELVDELFDPEFQTMTQQGTYDRDGFKDYVRAWRAAFSDLHGDVDDVIVEGDRAAWSVRAKGTHTADFMGIPSTGNTVEFDSLNIAEFRNGRFYRHTVMMDIPKMMGQLGVGG